MAYCILHFTSFSICIGWYVLLVHVQRRNRSYSITYLVYFLLLEHRLQNLEVAQILVFMLRVHFDLRHWEIA